MTTIPIANNAFSPRSAFVTSVGRGFSLMYGIATVCLIYGIATLTSIPGVPHWRLLMAAALVVDVGTLIAAWACSVGGRGLARPSSPRFV